MKTILVPTDFSTASLNAVNFAAEIAKLTNAKLVLFHVYQETSMISPDISVVVPIYDVLDETKKSLKELEANLHLKYGKNLKVESKFTGGFPVSEIKRFSEENTIDLIVVGMEGAGYLAEKFIGSVTTSLIKKVKCPVLAIERHVRYKSIKKIVFACDDESRQNKKVFEPLKEFAQLFKSHVYVLNVVPELESVTVADKRTENREITNELKGIQHTFHQTEHEDLIEGINDFIDKNKIDMLVMIPKTHGLIEDLFKERNTKRMAFHTKIPLLTLHE